MSIEWQARKDGKGDYSQWFVGENSTYIAIPHGTRTSDEIESYRYI